MARYGLVTSGSHVLFPVHYEKPEKKRLKREVLGSNLLVHLVRSGTYQVAYHTSERRASEPPGEWETCSAEFLDP